jgi:hypothetical protein
MSDPRTEIRHIQSIYNTAGDRGRIEEVIAVFAADGVLEIPGQALAGREAIAGFLSGVATKGAPSVDLRGSRHHLTTSRIELDGEDAAQGWTYFFVMRAGQVLQEGTYIDRFVRTAEGWRIAHRRVKILWTLGD